MKKDSGSTPSELEQKRRAKRSMAAAANGDPAVTLQWSEWHGMREDLKEATRLLRMAVEADAKGHRIDVGQIEGFLR